MDSINGTGLIAVVSSIYNNYLSKNLPSNTNSTVFFSQKQLPICICDFLERYVLIVSYHSRFRLLCSDDSFIFGMVYIDRLYEAAHISINPHTIHKLLVASLLIASKFSDEEYYGNNCFAVAGMITLEELNLLEREILSALEYRLYVSEKEFNRYCTAISTHYLINWHYSDETLNSLCYSSALYPNSFASPYEEYWMGNSYWNDVAKTHCQSVPQFTDYDLTTDYWYFPPLQNGAMDNWNVGDSQ